MITNLYFVLTLFAFSFGATTGQQQASRLEIEHSWPGGMTAHICIDHSLAITCGWLMEVVFSEKITKLEIWSAKIKSTEEYNGGTKFTLKHKHWTKEASNGICYRFNAYFGPTLPDVTAQYIKTCNRDGFNDVPTPQDEDNGQSWRLEIENSWPGGMTAEICIDHNMDINCGWEMELIFSRKISNFEIWDAVVNSQTPHKRGTKVILRHVEWTENEPNGTCHRFNVGFGRKRPTVTAQYTKICTDGVWTDLVEDEEQPLPDFTDPGPEDFVVRIESSWSIGIVGDICLFHTTPITCGFDAEIIVSAPVTKFRIWSMAVVQEYEVDGLMRYQLTNLESEQSQPNNPQCHRFMIKHKTGEKPTVIKGHYTRSCDNGQDNNDPNKGGTITPPTTTTITTTMPTTEQITTTVRVTTGQQPITTTSEISATSPEQLVTTPEKPAATPENPATTPEKHATTPENPATTPEKPATSPEEPVTSPEKPTATSEKSATTPEQPSMSTPYTPSEPNFHYGQALNKSMQFFFTQRSGPIVDSIVPWRTTDSTMTDGSDVPRDLVGGWFDAGDFVKFGFPMAASATNLLWGMVEYEQAYRATGELDMMYSLIRHPLEYFLKCWDNEQKIFYGQVGNGGIDHAYWGRPEDMTVPRPSYKLDTNNGGSELAAETAAALSAGYMVFLKTDPEFAEKMFTASKQLYDFADKYRKAYHLSIQDAAGYYRSYNGYQDELCWGAAWLFAATGDSYYKTKAKQAMSLMDQNPGEFSWDSKAIGCYTLMLKLGDEQEKSLYTTKVTNFMNRWIDFNGGITKTPCGLAWLREWGALRYSANTALIALMAADQGVNTYQYREWAEGQIKYMLGANKKKISYLIGYGTDFPRQPHHRASSCKLAPQPCSWTDYNSQSPNPQVLNGALVGGPDKNGNYEDKRTDYVKNEVTTDYNAGFQSVLAGLITLDINGGLPKQSTLC